MHSNTRKSSSIAHRGIRNRSRTRLNTASSVATAAAATTATNNGTAAAMNEARSPRSTPGPPMTRTRVQAIEQRGQGTLGSATSENNRTSRRRASASAGTHRTRRNDKVDVGTDSLMSPPKKKPRRNETRKTNQNRPRTKATVTSSSETAFTKTDNSWKDDCISSVKTTRALTHRRAELKTRKQWETKLQIFHVYIWWLQDYQTGDPRTHASYWETVLQPTWSKAPKYIRALPWSNGSMVHRRLGENSPRNGSGSVFPNFQGTIEYEPFQHIMGPVTEGDLTAVHNLKNVRRLVHRASSLPPLWWCPFQNLRSLDISCVHNIVNRECAFRALCGLTQLSCPFETGHDFGAVNSALFRWLPKLNELHLYVVRPCTLEKEFSQYLSGLETLHILRCRVHVPASALNGLSNLTNFCVSKCHACSFAGDECFQKLSNITSLALRNDVSGITSNTFRHMPRIESLLHPPSTITSEAFVHLKRLKNVDLSDGTYSFPSTSLLPLKSLTKLTMKHMPDVKTMDLSHFMKLTHLDLHGCTATDYRTSDWLPRLKSLKHLDLSNSSIANEMSYILPKLTNLQSLCLFSCSRALAGLSCFRDLKNLTHLGFSFNGDMIVQDFEYLSGLKELKLELPFGSRLGNDAFSHLSNLTSLYLVNLCSVSNPAFTHLTQLRSLFFDSCCSDGLTGAMFSGMRNLKSLSLVRCCDDNVVDAAFRLNLEYLDVHFNGHQLDPSDDSEGSMYDSDLLSEDSLTGFELFDGYGAYSSGDDFTDEDSIAESDDYDMSDYA